MRANNGGNEMRKEDRYNEISEIRAETSIDNNSGLFVNANVANMECNKNIANKVNSTLHNATNSTLYKGNTVSSIAHKPNEVKNINNSVTYIDRTHNIDTASVINATTNNKVSNASSINVASNAICAKTKVEDSKSKTNTLTNREEKVLSKVQALHKRAGLVNSKVSQRASAYTQHTNTLMRSTVQLVLWLLAFVLSTMIVYFTNTNSVFNTNNAIAVDNEIVTDAGTDFRPNGGDGTPESPYRISSANDLKYLSLNQSSYLSSHFILTADITYTCADTVEATARWTPIGISFSNKFTGTFDGNNYSITFTQTIHITSASGDVYGGLFGYVQGTSSTQQAEIKNLGVNWAGDDPVSIPEDSETQYTGLVVTSDSFDSSSRAYAGGIVGDAYDTTISNCYNTGAVTATSSSRADAGGIVGYANSTTIINCYNTGAVTATYSSNAYAGGIAGFASTTIINCYNTGAVTATSSSNAYAGGIAGRHGTISNCYNTGSVSATATSFSAYAGGISGFASTTIINCFSIDPDLTDNINTAPSGKTVGGIVGDGGTVSYSYHNYVSLENVEGKGTYVSDLTDYLVYSSGDASSIVNNYTSGFGNHEWYNDETGTEYYPWNFDIIWEVNTDTNTNSTQPLIINIRLPQFSGGDGTQESPYVISYANDLKMLSKAVNFGVLNYAYYRVEPQNEVIEITDNTWNPIGTEDNPFRGVFDGDGHSITFTQTIHITSSSGTVYGGLFGYVGSATIKNLGVNWLGKNEIAVGEENYTGLIVSSNDNSNIVAIGGIAGGIMGTIYNCYNTGAINGIVGKQSDGVGGGIAGQVMGTIYNCYNTGAINVIGGGQAQMIVIGGIAGNAYDTTIINCYNTGAINGIGGKQSDGIVIGGIAGVLMGIISNCYNTG